MEKSRFSNMCFIVGWRPMRFTSVLRIRVQAQLALACFCFCGSVLAVEKVYYPEYQLKLVHSINFKYPLELLKLAIAKSGNQVDLQPASTDLTKKRSQNELKTGNTFDIYWGTTSIELERDSIPVRICLMKGLMGWRIPLVAKKNQNLFRNAKTLGDLQQFTAGQGTHWQDTKILRFADLKVESSSTVDLLSKMLVADRFDYFPRGVQEIWEERELRPEMDIVVDPHIAIHYMNPFYFFVTRNKPELAKLVQQGLETAIKDGSFDKLFFQYYSEPLRKANIGTRTIIELENPFLPPNTPVDGKTLWLPSKEANSKT